MNGELGDFTATRRMIPVSVLALGIGVLSAGVAFVLLRLIALFTNLFYFGTWSYGASSPASSSLGLVAALVPVAGGLIIGVMARYGSERIRGHGIPEALEAILTRGSRVEPRVALLKPVSAAVSIGSGGPFGSEGPIIMTGGAFGSMIAQLFRLTAAERKTLLVSGAAAGMSATFAAPIASVLLAVELLLFELKPRSLVPVALASATAAAFRVRWLGPGPIFHVNAHHATLSPGILAACAVVGLVVGVIALLMTWSVYASEDFFKRVPLHWMWWPALGGLGVGLGGLVCPRALGVGYDTIEALLRGSLPLREVAVLVVSKWAIWAFSLGSGTSGGVLAPLLMMGSAAGSLLHPLLPQAEPGFYSVVALGAILGGTMRAPLTGILFAVELTADRDMMLPLLIACTAAHGFTVLAMRRSILTEKVARRGFHVSREYAIDPLDVLFVRDVMDAGSGLTMAGGPPGSPGTAHPDEPLREVVQRMAATGRTELSVVSRGTDGAPLGVLTLAHTLEARRRHVEEEQRRERVIRIDVVLRGALRNRRSGPPPARSNGASSP